MMAFPRRGLLMAAITAPLLSACSRSRTFDLAWEEEVQLHDGRVITAKLKYGYERLGSLLTFDRYEPSILRTKELAFDAGPLIGRFTQFFLRLPRSALLSLSMAARALGEASSRRNSLPKVFAERDRRFRPGAAKDQEQWASLTRRPDCVHGRGVWAGGVRFHRHASPGI